MKFFAVTVNKLLVYVNKEETVFDPAIKVRYRIEDIQRYQELDGKAIVYFEGSKLYVEESVEQIDLILNGANEKTVGLLYGVEK